MTEAEEPTTTIYIKQEDEEESRSTIYIKKEETIENEKEVKMEVEDSESSASFGEPTTHFYIKQVEESIENENVKIEAQEDFHAIDLKLEDESEDMSFDTNREDPISSIIEFGVGNIGNIKIELGVQVDPVDLVKLATRKSRRKGEKKSVKSSSSIMNNKRQLFRDEFLDLQCEWKNCSAKESRMEDFMKHVSRHIIQAEVIHNPLTLCDSFACLWNLCGFETANSQEMVRHINFHAFHTKSKCHGRNMLSTFNISPCKMDPNERNILPDLSEPFQCEWQGCHMANHRWDMIQSYYWHVREHAEDVIGSGRDVKCAWAGCDRSESVSKLKEHLRFVMFYY